MSARGAFTGAVLTVGMSLGLAAEELRPQQNKWSPHIDMTAKVGNDRHVGKIDLFWPLLMSDTSMLFADMRGVVASDPIKEGNFGLGFRKIQRDSVFGGSDFIWGAYGFFDIRSSENNNFFHQFTGGVELMTENLEFRVNGYLPNRKKHVVSSTSSAVVSGTAVLSSGSDMVEMAMPGFDVEAGAAISLPFGNDQKLWMYGGYYRFERDDFKIDGPRLRLELPIEDAFGFDDVRLTLGGEVRHDAFRKTDGFAFLRLRIPLNTPDGGSALARSRLDALERRMTRFVVRDTDIITPARSKSTSGRPVTDPDSGDAIDVYHVAEGAAGDCSQDDPCSLATAQGLGGPGDVYVLRDAGGTINTATTVNLADRQIIAGAGGDGNAALNLSSGDTLSLTGLGGRPELNGTNAGNDVVAFANTNTIMGVNISGGNRGITGDGAADAKISDVTVADTAGASVHLKDSTGTTRLTSVTIENAGDAGVVLDNPGGTVAFNATAINNPAKSGIVVRNTAGAFNLDGAITVTNSRSEALAVESSADGSTVNVNADLTVNNFTQTFAEDFESYAAGSTLNGQGGWTGDGSIKVNNATYMTSKVHDGREFVSGIQNTEQNNAIGALDSSKVYVLLFDAYATSAAPASTNTFVWLTETGATGNEHNVIWTANGSGWNFSGLRLDGTANQTFTTDGVNSAYNRTVTMGMVIDGVNNKFFGTYDFGNAPKETSRFNVTDGDMASMKVLALDVDQRSGPRGGEFDNFRFGTGTGAPGLVVRGGLGSNAVNFNGTRTFNTGRTSPMYEENNSAGTTVTLN